MGRVFPVLLFSDHEMLKESLKQITMDNILGERTGLSPFSYVGRRMGPPLGSSTHRQIELSFLITIKDSFKGFLPTYIIVRGQDTWKQ